jgi:hypothetical protein
MDILLWVALALAVLAIGVGGFFGIRYLWIRAVKRALVSLVSRREAIQASRRTLEAVMRHLADEDDDSLALFATHPESEDRRALAEVTARMEIAVEELDTRALPSPLVPVAEGLADAAFVIYEEAGRVGGSSEADEVFAALAEVDLLRVSSVVDAADERVKAACERYHLDEAAVYGGGLYI